MTKDKIQQAYKEANDYVANNPANYELEDLVNLGIQMAINGEVCYKEEDGTIQRID